MDSRSLGECPVCNEDFNEHIRCPRSLPCSHYLCTDCIETLIKKNKKQCPFCRRSFKVKSAQEVMINRAILDLMKCLTPRSNSDRELSEGIATLRYLKKETAETIESLFLSCVLAKSEAESSLQRITSTNQKIEFRDKKIKEVISKLVALGEDNFINKSTLNNENIKLTSSLKDIDEIYNKLRNIKLKLDRANTFEETGALMDEMKNIRAAIKMCEEELKGFSSEDKLQEIDEDVQMAKQKFSSILDVIDSMKTKPKEFNSIPKGKPHISPNIRSGVLTVRELQEKTQRVQDLARQGKLFAIQNQGTKRSAKITIRGDKLLLHHLTGDTPPSCALTLEHSEALTMVDSSSRLAFLELSDSNQKLGTLYIRLTPATPSARQFALLCTGKMGPSYANSQIIRVLYRNSPMERVHFGDYENQNGNGGRALVKGLFSGSTKRPIKLGTVAGVGCVNGSDSVSAQFTISTKLNPGKWSSLAFGDVVEGLDILKNAVVNNMDIKDVCICDCGLVLSASP